MHDISIDRMKQSAAEIWNFQGLKTAVTVFLISRVILSLWAILVVQLIPGTADPHPLLRPYLGVDVSSSFLFEPWQRWDTLHYQAIAERGYTAFGSAIFVPPLYPFLIRSVSSTFNLSTLTAGILVGNLAYLLGLLAFYHYVLEETRDENVSRRALFYLASFPASFFFLAAYTEPVFLLFSGLTLLTFLKKRWVCSGIFGGAAALTRLTGTLLIAPLTAASFLAKQARARWTPWLAVVGTALGSALFPLYLWMAVDKPPWAPLKMQTARFHGGFSFPGMNVVHSLEKVIRGQALIADYLDLAFILMFALLIIPVINADLSLLSKVYYLSFLLLYLTREAGTQPLLGSTRYVLVFLPAFIVMAKAGRNPMVNRLVLYVSWSLQLFMAGQFVLWGWIG